MRLTDDEYTALIARMQRGIPETHDVRPPMPERQLQSQVLFMAKRLGWEHIYHTYDSQKSTPGFPDLVLCRPGRLLFVELKREDGRLTGAQQRWLAALAASAPGVEAYCWRPADLPQIAEVLR